MKKDIERFRGGRRLNSGTHRWIADSVLLFVAFIWGTTFVLVQNAIETLPPFTFLAIRFTLAGLFLLLFFRWRNVTYRIPFKHLAVGALIGIWLFLGYALQTFSLLYTTSGKSGFLTGLSVALVPIWSLVLLGVKPRPTATAGVLLAVSGLYLLAFADFSSINRGDVLALLCAVAFGLQIVYTAKYAPKVEALHLVTIQIFTVALLSGGCSLLFEPWERVLRGQSVVRSRCRPGAFDHGFFGHVPGVPCPNPFPEVHHADPGGLNLFHGARVRRTGGLLVDGCGPRRSYPGRLHPHLCGNGVGGGRMAANAAETTRRRTTGPYRPFPPHRLRP